MTLKSDAKFEEKLNYCFKNNNNLVNFDPSTQSLKNFHFDWSLSGKVYNVWYKKKSTEELSFMVLMCHAKFEEKLTCGLKNEMRNLAIFHQSSWKCQNWDFDGILLSKVEKTWAKHYRGVMCHDNEKWCKLCRVIDL